MNPIIDRIAGFGINPEAAVFSITSKCLITAISEEVDLESVTDIELREIITIITAALSKIDWLSVVRYSVAHLPFGLNQIAIAMEGNYPCTNCPDAMREDEFCHHEGECKAWEIYESSF